MLLLALGFEWLRELSLIMYKSPEITIIINNHGAGELSHLTGCLTLQFGDMESKQENGIVWVCSVMCYKLCTFHWASVCKMRMLRGRIKSFNSGGEYEIQRNGGSG